ncbi:MAG: AraC family transcriptional regulator [Planctomycetota bacterium]
MRRSRPTPRASDWSLSSTTSWRSPRRATQRSLKLPWHAHEHTCLVYVVDGTFTEQLRSQVIDCRPATLTIKPAGEEHPERLRLQRLLQRGGGVAAAFESRLRALTTTIDHAAHVTGGPAVAMAARLYRELRGRDPFSPLVFEGLVLEMLGSCAARRPQDRQRRAPRWLEHVRERLHADFARKLSITRLAEEAGVHPDHLTRIFRRHHGVLIGDYLRRVRTQWAAETMVHSELPLVAIAQHAGFADQSQLTRSFKREFGITPARYRAAARSR